MAENATVRNCLDIGINGQKIMKRLLANQNLLKLLYYNDDDPLSHEDLTNEQIQTEIFEKLVKITPRIGPKEGAESIISIVFAKSTPNENAEFKDVHIMIEIFIPLTQWIIKDINLRPFAIMGEIQKSLNGKTINGLGKLSGGEFDINFLTEEMSAYKQYFRLTTYD